MTCKTFIIGAGGLASEVLSVLKMQRKKIGSQDDLYFVIEREFSAPPTAFTFPLLVGLEQIPTIGHNKIYVAVGDVSARSRIVKLLRLNGHNSFPNLIHPDFKMGLNVTINEGVFAIGPGIITANSKIGSFSIINPLCSISHDCIIGDFVNLGPGVLLAGGVTIGNGADIGVGARVAPRKNIGQRAVLGAGAVAIRDIPAGATAVGVPTKVIKEEM